MKCNKIREMIPEYIVGICTIEEQNNISEHIKNCVECRKYYEKMKNESDQIESQSKAYKIKSLNKIQRKFYFKISVVSLIVVMFVMYTMNQAGSGFFHGYREPERVRAKATVTDFYQFTSGKLVGGNGIREDKYHDMIDVYIYDCIGTKTSSGLTKDFKYDLIKNKVQVDYWLDIIAVHPEIEPLENIKKYQNVEIAEKILGKNGDDTVSVVDISLNEFISYEEAVEYLNKYDISILWMSIDSGIEGKKISNMSNGKNQHFQFGIPGRLLKSDNYEIEELNKENGSEYKRLVLQKLRELNANLDILEPGNMRERAGYETGVLEDEIEYILENGIKVYGLQVTGPSDELSRLLKDISPRLAKVRDIDFWYWDK